MREREWRRVIIDFIRNHRAADVATKFPPVLTFLSAHETHASSIKQLAGPLVHTDQHLGHAPAQVLNAV